MSVEFDNIINFRDVGKTVNDFLGRKLVLHINTPLETPLMKKTGSSGKVCSIAQHDLRADDATVNDRRRLTDELGIRTVMDLRTKTEHLSQAEKRQADLKIPALLQSNAALAEPVQIPGLVYREVRVTGKRFERYLLHQLSWWSFFKLIFLFIFGYRLQAIRIMGREVMQPLGLVGLSLVTLDESGPEIVEALKILISTETPRPVLVHCTQGKDRTGVIIALALLILNVPTDAITHDYLLSEAGLAPERETRLAEILQIGLTPAWGDCPPEMIERVRGHLDVQHGGVEGYLDTIGFGIEDRTRLVEVLSV